MKQVAVISFKKTVTTLEQQFWPGVDAPWPTVGWSNRSFPSLASTTLKNFLVISILLSEVSRVHNHTSHRPDVSLYLDSVPVCWRREVISCWILFLSWLFWVSSVHLTSFVVIYPSSLNSTGRANLFEPDTFCNWMKIVNALDWRVSLVGQFQRCDRHLEAIHEMGAWTPAGSSCKVSVPVVGISGSLNVFRDVIETVQYQMPSKSIHWFSGYCRQTHNGERNRSM